VETPFNARLDITVDVTVRPLNAAIPPCR
jgi:hypothetical protein